jgi:hypothetical protein
MDHTAVDPIYSPVDLFHGIRFREIIPNLVKSHIFCKLALVLFMFIFSIHFL